ncbi:MAG TPA: sn-glycerol-3-phosphate ABC transporter ATP-binding protein UgpC, partial [Actinomycetota bacterium]|nr:sn-glycerol-3-phosphate ABC transporter ATP-binding protein UgpC [Actinomycetota bacterium]
DRLGLAPSARSKGGRMAEIALDSVSKIYPGGTTAVDEIDLNIDDGEFMVFVGPSGCGKTTALRMVAGLEAISGGEVRIGDKVVNDVAPKDRDIAMVFQNYALYPHMTVRDNMAFGLKLAKLDKSEIDKRVEDAAKILGLQEFLDRKPRALSGGQRQRVAMGRAIVRQPQAFLMDEPLSNLDAKLRVQMRAEIARIQRDLKVTTIYVTHDQVEAMTMGDRVAVIRKGTLQQVGSPQELFAHPVNLFVAGFIGSPSMNFVESTLESSGGGYRVDIGGQALPVGTKLTGERPALERFAGRKVIVGIRPQDFEDSNLATTSDRGATLKANVELVEALGTETLVHFNVDAPAVVTEDMKELAADVGADQLDRLEESAKEGRNEFVAQLDPRTRIQRGDEVELVVDTSQLHFFDPETSQGIYS